MPPLAFVCPLSGPHPPFISLLQGATCAPSGGNLQPWHVYAVTGSVRDDLCAAVQTRFDDGITDEGAE